jgi:hypothetical protein
LSLKLKKEGKMKTTTKIVITKRGVMKKFMILSIILLNFFMVSPVSAADVLYKIFGQSYETGKFGNDTIWDMAIFDGKLYIAAYNNGNVNLSRVFRLKDGCNLWDDVTPPWLGSNNNCRVTMRVFKNYLYVNNGNQVFRFNGNAWSDVTGNLPVVCGNDMDELNGKLYLSGTWRIKDDTVVPHVWENVWNAQFNCPNGRGSVESLEYFNGYLYAGVGCDAPNGIEIWSTNNGTSWTSVKEEHNIQAGYGHVKGMKPFGNHLYVAPYGHGGCVDSDYLWRTDGSIWDDAVAIPCDALNPFRFAEHNSYFYLSKGNLWPGPEPEDFGKPLLYVSADGTQWNAVDEGPKLSSDIHAITSLLSHEGKLYIATTGDLSTGELAVYALGPCPCTVLKQATVSITPETATSELFPGATHTFSVQVDAGGEFDFDQCLVDFHTCVEQYYGEGGSRVCGYGWVSGNGLYTGTYKAQFQGPTALRTDDIEACISAVGVGVSICDYATNTWVDTTPPVITITTPANGANYILNEVVAADYVVQDAVGVVLIIVTPNVAVGRPIPTGQLGTQTFTVTAKDYSNNSATKSVTYQVMTPVEGTQELISEVVSSPLPQDIEDGLKDKLAAAINALNKGNEKAAINILNAFINMVNAQRGKTLTNAQADSWIAEAQKIINSINAS